MFAGTRADGANGASVGVAAWSLEGESIGVSVPEGLMGEPLGLLLDVGSVVGAMDGCKDGVEVESDVSPRLVGDLVDLGVGEAVGLAEGLLLGLMVVVGACDGVLVGPGLREVDRGLVGARVGDAVGAAVGAIVVGVAVGGWVGLVVGGTVAHPGSKQVLRSGFPGSSLRLQAHTMCDPKSAPRHQAVGTTGSKHGSEAMHAYVRVPNPRRHCAQVRFHLLWHHALQCIV